MSNVLASSIFWAAVAICAIAQLAIARSALRAPSGASTVGTAPRWRSAAEVLWVVLPALMLAGTLLLTWRALEARATPAGDVRAARSAQHAAALHPASLR